MRDTSIIKQHRLDLKGIFDLKKKNPLCLPCRRPGVKMTCTRTTQSRLHSAFVYHFEQGIDSLEIFLYGNSLLLTITPAA